jgi:hypothetical protein
MENPPERLLSGNAQTGLCVLAPLASTAATRQAGHNVRIQRTQISAPEGHSFKNSAPEGRLFKKGETLP